MLRGLIFSFLVLICFFARGSDLAQKYDSALQIYKQGKYYQAKAVATSFLPIAKKEGDIFYQVKFYFLLAYLGEGTDDRQNAVIYYLKAAALAERSDDPELKKKLISIYKNLSGILSGFNDYRLAHKFIDRGLKVATETKNEDQLKSLLHNRISYLLEEEKYPEALQQIYAFQSMPNLSELHLVKMRNQKGVALKNLGNLDQAMSDYQYVIQNTGEIQPELYSAALQNIGSIYFEKKKYVKALHFYNKQIEYSKVKKLNQMLFQAYYQAGKATTMLRNYEKAIDYFHHAILLKDSTHMEPDNYPVYKYLSEAYHLAGDMKNALHFQNVYTQELEEFIDRQNKIKELNKQFNFQLLTERYFELLAEENESKETRKAVFATAIVLAFLIIIYFRKYLQQFIFTRSI